MVAVEASPQLSISINRRWRAEKLGLPPAERRWGKYNGSFIVEEHTPISLLDQIAQGPEIYVLQTDGSYQWRVTANHIQEELGEWSPDGTWIVYVAHGNDTERCLWVRNPDGVNLVYLTTGQDRDPVYIAFVRGAKGQEDIYIIEAGRW